MKVLIVEDDKQALKKLTDQLTTSGFKCDTSETIADAEDFIINFDYEIALLDLDLPDGSGFSLIELIRKTNFECRIIIISSSAALTSKINGLELDADDYITKPVDQLEVELKVKAFLRRKYKQSDNIFTFNEIQIDLEKEVITINKEHTSFSSLEIRILAYLISRKNKPVKKEDIIEHIWNKSSSTLENYDNLYSHMKKLRGKLKSNCLDHYLKSVYGIGYMISDMAE